MNDKTLYRILNLASGDNIIGQITETKQKEITIYRPFQMKVISIVDNSNPMSHIFRKEALIFRNWLEFSDDQKVTITNDKVIAMSQPTNMVSTLYDQEKEKEDNPKFMQNLLDQIKRQAISEEIEEALNDTEEDMDFSFDDIDDIDDISKNIAIEIDPEDVEDFIKKIIEDARKTSSEDSEDSEEVDNYDEDKDMFGW